MMTSEPWPRTLRRLKCRILFTGGPPWHDFSIVKDIKDGRSGTEGRKFTLMCDKADQLEGLLPNHHFDFIIENVLMNDPGDLQYFNDRLRAQPIVLDSADLGIVNRPRLWWSRLDWKQLRRHPVTREDLQWSQVQEHRKLHLGMPLQDPSSFTDRQLELDSDVRSRKKRVPCLTTPSPNASGRDPPKRQRGKTSDAAKQRWMADGRCYAPWQYESWAMAAGPDGPVNLTATMKQKLHNYPADWTAVHGVATRARHRMLANSWHVMVTFTDIGHWESSRGVLHPATSLIPLEPGLAATVSVYFTLHQHLRQMRSAVIDELHNMVSEWELH